MVSNSGNGNKHNGSSNPNSGNKKKELKLKSEQYWKLSCIQKDKDIIDFKILSEEKEKQIRQQNAKIANLEHSLIVQKIGALKQIKKNNFDELNKYRESIAKELDIKTLDPYLVDEESFVLTHEDEIKV